MDQREIIFLVIGCIFLIISIALIISLIIGYKYWRIPSKKIEKKLKGTITNYEEKIQELDQLDKSYKLKVSSLANLTFAELKAELKNIYSNELAIEKNKDLSIFEKELQNEKNYRASKIIIEVMGRIAEPYATQNTTSYVKLDNENLKGKIIGREGRNKKLFEHLTGTDLIIDKETKLLVISSPNQIRREIGKNLLIKLIALKSIDPARIEISYEEEKANFEYNMTLVGEDALINRLKINDINPKIYPYVGRLFYRNSYGQNILSHSIECAEVAANIAQELNLDVDLAKKAAFFHDIGKSIDFEVDKDHIQAGLEIAIECELNKEIINAIHSHHGDIGANNIYSEITMIADTLSAARPGARYASSVEYFKRIDELEAVVNKFPEVSNCYCIKSGHQIRVLISPSEYKSDDLSIIANEIKNTIQNNPALATFKIKIVVIKECRYECDTSIKKSKSVDYHPLSYLKNSIIK